MKNMNNGGTAEELKNQFLTVLAHELRTPMTITKGYISMLLEGTAGELNPKAQDFLKEIYQGNEKLIRLVNDMEKVVQIDTGQLHFDIQPVPVFPIITEVINQFLPLVKEKHLDVRITISDDPYLTVFADLHRLKEVVSAIIENAVKFTDRGEIVVSSTTEIVNGIKSLVVSISDTGIGIPRQFHGRIFEKFAHVNFTLTGQRGGTGLGLYITKKLLEGMRGTIRVESKPEKGSTFYFTLPLAIKPFQQ